jgi:hypothetical protein
MYWLNVLIVHVTGEAALAELGGFIMNECRAVYAHSLLFRCDGCKGSIALTVISAGRTLEEIDGSAFDLFCKCGWIKRALGIEAARHHVTPWERRSLDDNGVSDTHMHHVTTPR